jgi:ATP-binding cassette subfamily B protein
VLSRPLHAWPAERLGEALETLARTSGLAPRPASLPRAPARPTGEGLDRWLAAASDRLGIEAEPVECALPELDSLLRRAAPALVRVPRDGGFLLIRRASGRRLLLLDPDLRPRAVAREDVRAALAGPLEAEMAAAVSPLLERLALSSSRRRDRARAALVGGRLADARVAGVWILRTPPGTRFWAQVAAARLPGRLLGFVACHVLAYLCLVGSFWLVGRGALRGSADWGWIVAWILLLATLVPLRMTALWFQGVVDTLGGGLLKRRLLRGALRLHPDEVRQLGAGHHLGRVLEADALESLALSGGFLATMAALDLVVVALVLAAGAGGARHALMLALWVGLGALAAVRLFSKRRAWARARLRVSHELLERMVGHRTRLAQEPPERWHEEEDRSLARYHAVSRSMDHALTLLIALPRGFLVLGLLLLAPALLRGSASLPLMAVGIGGVILGYEALRRLVAGLALLADAAISWREVSLLFHAAAREEPAGDPALVLASDSREGPVLQATDLSYRYPTRTRAVLSRCGFELRRGERALMEGPSGGGKSTLVALLGGLREPDSGLLLLHGLDRRSLGSAEWRRRVAIVPQFHDNHVLTETFAFNLLMGRGWPPSPEDLAEAEALCRELGLGELIDRMPAGLLQMVGEGGWRLSHGQKSRLFLARALLQPSELVVLDESFGALDPESLGRALACSLRRAPTLLVIAHP